MKKGACWRVFGVGRVGKLAQHRLSSKKIALGCGAQVGGRLDIEAGVILHQPRELPAGVRGVDAVRLVDEQVEFGETLALPFCDALGPLGESRLVGRVPFVPAEPNKDKRGRHPHVQGVPAPRRVADDGAHAKTP